MEKRWDKAHWMVDTIVTVLKQELDSAIGIEFFMKYIGLAESGI